MKILNLFIRIFLVAALIFNAACTSTKHSQQASQSQEVKQEEKEEAQENG